MTSLQHLAVFAGTWGAGTCILLKVGPWLAARENPPGRFPRGLAFFWPIILTTFWPYILMALLLRAPWLIYANKSSLDPDRAIGRHREQNDGS